MNDKELMRQALSAFEAILFEKNIEATQIIAKNARYSLREALAQPESDVTFIDEGNRQEPVVWHHPECAGKCIACLIELKVHEEYGQQGLDYLRKKIGAPPKREWVGLTDEDWENTPNTGKKGCERDVEMFDWIEQTLKDKNT